MWASQVELLVKNLPVNAEIQKTWVRSLGQKDPLEESMATHSSILAWRIPWTEEPGRLPTDRVAKSWTPLRQLSMHAQQYYIQRFYVSLRKR